MIPIPNVALLTVAAAVALTCTAVFHAVAAQRSGVMAARLAAPAPPVGPPGWFLTALDASGLPARPERAWTAVVRLGVVGAALAAWQWPQVVVAASILGIVLVRVRGRALARREHRDYDSNLVFVIDALISRLATGTSLALALEEGSAHRSPVGSDLADVLRRHRHGQAIQDAIDGWAVTRSTPGVRLLADALAIAGRSGGSQRAALLGVQTTLRDREALGREVRALASQARTSGVVLAVTPAVFAAVVAAVDSRVAAFYSTPAGWVCLLGGAVLDGAGALWMHRLTEAHT